MEANTASLTDVRLDSLNLESGMNSGPSSYKGDVAFNISSKSSYSVGGEDDEAPYVLGRVKLKVKAVYGESQKLFHIDAEFVGRFDFDSPVSEEEVSKLIADRDYCEILGIQMQSYVSSKFSDLVTMVGLDLRLPLNLIRLRPSQANSEE